MDSFTGIDKILVYCIYNFRWVFVCLFLLPCTITYDLLVFLRKKLTFSSPKELNKSHQEKVRHIQEQVNQWRKSNQDVPMCTARPGWKAMTLREPKYKKYMYNIQIDLDEILEINSEKQVVTVEPLVTMGQLSETLNTFGLTLPVLVELEDLTVGGLVMGQGIESSSHIYGFFQHICVSFELVLADGSLVRCSKDEDPDLFYCVPWSYGSLGFLTAIELKTIPSKRYVALKYEPVYTLEEAVRLCKIRSEDTKNVQFVEGIMFSRDEGVIMSGRMVDSDNTTSVNTISRWYKPWFYEHVRSFLWKGESEELIPLRDYYHRHTKALFWELKDIVPFGNHPIFRWILGWAMPPKISFLKLTQTKVIKELYDKHHVVQDLIIPLQHMKEAVDYFDKTVNIYPVWVCPVILSNEPGLVHSFSNKPEIYVDIGIYGTPNTAKFDSVETTKQLENFTIKCKGYQMLYAGTYCTEQEFRAMFDHSLYERVRDRLQCQKAFPSVYGKVNRNVRD